jgi:hypothetical protein
MNTFTVNICAAGECPMSFRERKKMCYDCSLTVCPPTCPNGSCAGIPVCALCDGPILEGDSHYACGGTRICEACADSLALDDLIALGNLTDTGELLSLLGYRHL